MKLSEFIERASRHLNPNRPYNDPDLMIQYKPPFSTVGGTPCVPVKAYMNGFDWDSGKEIVSFRLTIARDEVLFASVLNMRDTVKALGDDFDYIKAFEQTVVIMNALQQS